MMMIIMGLQRTLTTKVPSRFPDAVALQVLNDMEHGAASKKLLGESDEPVRCGVGITFEEQDDRTLAGNTAPSLHPPGKAT